MQLGESTAGFGEGPEPAHLGDTRQGLLQVGGVGLAVGGGVEQPVDVEEDVIPGETGVRGGVRVAVGGERGVGDVVDAFVRGAPVLAEVEASFHPSKASSR